MNVKDLIKKIKEKSSIKTIICIAMVFIFALIINLITKPKYEIGYARIATKACPLIKQIEFCSSTDFEILKKDDNNINCSECKLISIYEKVIVINKNKELYDIYRDNKKIGSTKKEDIILETSSELNNLLKEKAAF